MTLIVARVKDGKLYMLGDTELTFHNQRKSNPFAAGCLKQYIVSDHIAIGFAGVREHFEKVLPDFLSCRTGQEIVELALDAQSNGLDFDLLVGEVGYEKIRAVKDGVLSQSEVAFIGNHDAFNTFTMKNLRQPIRRWRSEKLIFKFFEYLNRRLMKKSTLVCSSPSSE